jgi:hypothetical protein
MQEITSKRTEWLENLAKMEDRSMVRRCSWEIKWQEKAGKTQEIVFDDVDNDLRYREVRRG